MKRLLSLLCAGVAALLLPGETAAGAALVLLGLGCAPVYPSMIHATPARFGAERSQARQNIGRTQARFQRFIRATG